MIPQNENVKMKMFAWWIIKEVKKKSHRLTLKVSTWASRP